MNRRRQSGQTNSLANKDKKVVFYHGHLVFRLLQCLGHTQSKIQVALVEVSYFKNQPIWRCQNYLPTKIENHLYIFFLAAQDRKPLLYLFWAAQASNFYRGPAITNFGHVQSKNKDTMSAVSIFFNRRKPIQIMPGG